MSRDVVVLSAARSAIGSYGGSLSTVEPAELAGSVMKEAVARSGADPAKINYVTVGNTMPTDSRYAYVARVASIQAGLPMDSVAMAVNRLCSSGLQAIVTTAQGIMLNDYDYGVGGGVEAFRFACFGHVALHHRNGIEHLAGQGAGIGQAVLVGARQAAHPPAQVDAGQDDGQQHGNHLQHQPGIAPHQHQQGAQAHHQIAQAHGQRRAHHGLHQGGVIGQA